MNGPGVPRNSRFVTLLFLLVFTASVLLLLRLLAVYLAAIILALVLVTLFKPVFQRLEARLNNRRRLAAGITAALVVVVVMVPLSLVLTSLSGEALAAYERATSGEQPFVEQVLDFMQSDRPAVVRIRNAAASMGVDLTPQNLREHAANAASLAARFVYDQLRGLAANAIQTLMHFGLMIVVMFALFADGQRLKAYILDLSPIPDAQEEMLAARFASISRAVFLGNGVASLLQGVFGGVGFYFFDLGSGVLWGTAIAFFAFLPIVGASLVFVPAAAYLLLQGQVGLAVGFLVYNFVYVAALEYGLKPRLIGSQSHMSGVLVFLGILAGLSLFGILGLFYGPLILTMFLTLAEIYKSEYRDDLMAISSPWVHAGALGPQPPPPLTPPPSAPPPSTPAAAAPDDGTDPAPTD